jgi:uncharacterized membrane protein
MTCQLSDVNVISRSMRPSDPIAWPSLFAFNTVILALNVNIISDLRVNLAPESPPDRP